MLKKVLFVSCTALLSTVCFGQSETDSLRSLISSTHSDTARIQLLNKIVTQIRDRDTHRAFPLAQEAIDLSEKINYKAGLCYALENMGWLLYRRGDFSRSLEISTRALKVSEEIRDRNCVSRCLINIAAIHYEQNRFDKGIETLRKVCSDASASGNMQTLARGYNNIAYSFLALKKLDSAFHNAHRALTIGEAAGEKYLTAFAHRVLGDVCVEKKEYKKGLGHFNNAVSLASQVENNFIIASTYHRMGMAYSAVGDFENALKYLHDDARISSRNGFMDELERSYKNLAEVYYQKNDLTNAYRYQGEYIVIHDSLHAQRSSEQVAMMQTRFETEIKQAQIELLTKDTALKAEEIEHQRVWIYFYAGCLSLFTILVLILVYTNQQTNSAKKELEQKNREIEKHTQQLSDLNSTKDKLFSIISHDLRSPVASLRGLMDIVGKEGLSHAEFTQITNALKGSLDSVYDDLDHLLLWAQTQLKGFKAFPETVDVRKIAEDKIALFREQAVNKNITLINGIAEDTFVHADRNHVNLILRNLILNAIKFNKSGGTIELRAKESKKFFEISVSDSGVGISLDDIQKLFNAQTHFTRPGTNKEKGIGLGLMLSKEFIETNHGKIWVTSELGQGTTFTFTLKAAHVHALRSEVVSE
jgi:two-component system, sensor histidine kinase and response regulator